MKQCHCLISLHLTDKQAWKIIEEVGEHPATRYQKKGLTK